MATTAESFAAKSLPANESSVSAVSWAAVVAGVAVAVAVSLLLLALGTGFGFASISAWPGAGATVTAFSIMTGVWLIVMQWIASALGGFVTGRLRTRWVGVHTHEVFFRDTAHGFVTWAVATVLTAVVVASAAGAVAAGGARAASGVVSGVAQMGAAATSSGGALSGVSGYYVDSLFRATGAAPSAAGTSSTATPSGAVANGAGARGESLRILAQSLSDGELTSADRTYLAQLVSRETGISQPEAEQRVDAVVGQVKAAEVKARQAAEAARKAAAATSIFTALSMLIGAFIACVAAALGGRERDLQP
ncbi:MAG: hypothetical protein WDO56_29355 [Gammaproteobacteria bacterium]